MSTLKRIGVDILQVIAALTVCGITLYLMDSGIDVKWVMVGFFTLLIFGFICYRTRDLWQNPRYWATFAGLFLAHCLVIFELQRNLPMLPGVWYGFIGIVEGILLLALFIVGFNGGR